ncbi:MAG: glycoside hydrolase family 15 protein [Bacteroidales bacterium]|nr:glycoside hydrolase family 15 protein [Bacteroidales bacterium]
MDNLSYGLIGNCKSAALISLDGSIDWCCLPEFDSPSVFARILDDKIGGSMQIILNERYKTFQSYLKNTNILSTLFTDGSNSFEVLDFMPRYKTEYDRYFTPPEIYRYIRVVSGAPVVRFIYDPKLNYAAGETRHILKNNCIKSYVSGSRYESVYLYASFPLKDIMESNEIVLNNSSYILISYNEKLIDLDLSRVYLEYQRTKVYWLNWINRSRDYPLYNDLISRSLLVLKLLSYQNSGAILAAPTTSLPETIGEGRNWDYRFCWLRDASLTLNTLVGLGHFSAARRYMTYLKNIIKSKDESFQIMYGIRGERILEEMILGHLSGYGNSGPVRIGNAAYLQIQNDIYGFLLDLILLYYQYFAGTLDETEDIWSIARSLVRTVSRVWRNPDHGIWEIRQEPRHYVFSKVQCWVAVDRGIKIARMLHRAEYIEEWEKIANQIRYDIMSKGWSGTKQSFVQVYGGEDLDASLLLMEDSGFLKADDERYVSTVIAVKKELLRDGLMYRYKNPDGLGIPSSSFTTCTFWLVSSLYKIGMKDEAKQIFEESVSCANHLGLLSEDIDFSSRRLLGNFPQGYSHIALIQSAILFSNEITKPEFIKP